MQALYVRVWLATDLNDSRMPASLSDSLQIFHGLFRPVTSPASLDLLWENFNDLSNTTPLSDPYHSEFLTLVAVNMLSLKKHGPMTRFYSSVYNKDLTDRLTQRVLRKLLNGNILALATLQTRRAVLAAALPVNSYFGPSMQALSAFNVDLDIKPYVVDLDLSLTGKSNGSSLKLILTLVRSFFSRFWLLLLRKKP